MSSTGSKLDARPQGVGPLTDAGDTAPLFASSWMALFVLLRQEMESRLDMTAAAAETPADSAGKGSAKRTAKPN